MTDTPERLPQVGETWDATGYEKWDKLTLRASYGDHGLWESPGGAVLTVFLSYAAREWTPPEPPIEWERWLTPRGWTYESDKPDTSTPWRIVKREGREPTIERVEP